MRPLARTQALLVLTLCGMSAPWALADSMGPERAAAAEALQAGNPKLAISLLSPPPLAGPETCTLAQALFAESHEQRAMLYLDRCLRATPDASIRQQMSALKKKFRKAKLAPVSLSLSPADATATVDAIYDAEDVLLTDEDLWLPMGNYRIEVSAADYQTATFAVVVDSLDRMLLPLSLEKSAAIENTEIDLGDEPGSELGSVSTAADPRPKKFKPILPKRYQRAPDPTLVPEEADHAGHRVWPWIATAGGVVAIAGGIALQVNDKTVAALAGYGVGAGLLGLATFLFVRSEPVAGTQSDRISLTLAPDGVGCALGGHW